MVTVKNRSLARRCFALAVSTLTALVVVAGCADFSAEPTTFDVQPSLEPADLSPVDPQGASPTPTPNESTSGGETGPTAEEDPCRPADPSILAACLDAPWGLAVLPDGMSALVGERTTGRILLVAPQTEPMEVLTVPDLDSSGDGGLLGIALSPSFGEDGLIYVYVTTATDNRILRIARGDEPKPIFTGIPKGAKHNGGRIAFGDDGNLYIATGDADDPGTAAAPDSLSGKVLRLDEFGKPVTDGSTAPLPPPTSGEPSAPNTSPAPGTSQPAPEPSAEPNGTQSAPETVPTPESTRSIPETSPAATGSAVFATGLTNPTGMCLLETGGLAVIDRDGADDVLIPVTEGSDLTETARLWSYPATDGGANDCAAGNGTIAASSLDGQQVVSLNIGVGGGFTGQPEILVKETYGRLLSLSVAAQGLLIATTSNKDGFGEPKPRDDMVVIFPGGGGGGDGPD